MITRSLRDGAPLALLALSVFTTACQEVPLLAPSGSSITLTSQATSLAANGTTIITAQVIEPSGTPPHAGTLVSFSTTLGRIQPADAETDISGRATAVFSANGASGMATITAISGGVSQGATGAVKIALGAAAVSSILISASPLSLPAAGGTSTIAAIVNDTGGNAIGGVPVTFTTDAGSLSIAVVTTDTDGIARTVLTTGRTAKVTGTAGVASTSGTTSTAAPTNTVTVTVNAAATVTFGTFSPSPATAGVPVSTTLTVTPATTGAAIRNVVVNYGDGQTQGLGAISGATPISHTYNSAGVYTLTATATDANGDSSNGIAQVSVLAKPTPAVALVASPNPGTVNSPVGFTATVSQTSTGVTVDRFEWNFGDGATRTTTSNTTSHAYTGGSTTYTASVTAVMSDGVRSTSSTEVRIN